MTSRPRPRPVPDYKKSGTSISDMQQKVKLQQDREGTKKAGYRTFKEWSAAGFMIIKGSKSYCRRESDNVCLFHESQVKEKDWDPYPGGDLDNYDEEDMY